LVPDGDINWILMCPRLLLFLCETSVIFIIMCSRYPTYPEY